MTELENTADDARLVADESVEVTKTELPKSWTDDDRAKYRIVTGYLNSVDPETAQSAVFPGVPEKVVKRARRDYK